MNLSEYYRELDSLDDDDKDIFYQKVLEDAMGGNDANAFFILGRMYLEGYGVSRDMWKALKYFRIAYELPNELDSFDAITPLNKHRDEYILTDKIKKSFMSFLEYLAERDEFVLIVLADEYGSGELTARDIKKKMELYELAGDKGETFGYAALGEMYYKGEEVEKNYQKAYDYLIKADDNRSTIKEFYLGEMYRQGIVVKQDIKEAVKYYKRIADQSDFYQGDENLDMALQKIKELEGLVEE